MPKITNKSINEAYEEYTDGISDIISAYPEIQQYLQHHFGIHRGKLKVWNEPGGESVYLIFRSDIYWLFEVDEFNVYFYDEEERFDHISNRLSKAYDQIAKKYF